MPQKLVNISNPHPSKASLLLLLLLAAVILATRKRILAHQDPHSFVQTFKIQMFMVLFPSKPFAHNDGSGWSGHVTVLVFWVLILQLLLRCASWP
jgi:membrane-associated PAP2 superfamily phosphatase